VATQQRPPFAHAAAILRREDEQCWHVYPHQVVSLGVARLEGDWHICWEQLVGPFVYETTTDGARVTMELFGPGKFLVSLGAGEIDVIVDGSALRYKAAAGSEMQVLRCPVGSTSDSASYILRHVDLVWHKPADASGANARLRWSGLWCQEIQPWFREEIPIDADFLRAYLPSP